MPKGIRKLQIIFGETHLTHFGGIFLIHHFCQKIKLKWIFQSYIKFYRQNNRYTPAEMILCLIYTIIIGLGRVYTTRILRYNGSFQDIVGLKNFPYFTTLRNFLLRLTPKVLQQIITIHDTYRLKMFSVFTQRANINNSGWRFRSYSCIWEIRRSKDWLQPKKTRASFVLPNILFRSTYTRTLAWKIPCWRTNWTTTEGIHRRMFPEITRLYLSDSFPWRCQIFQKRSNRISRGEKDWLCCSSPIASIQEQIPRFKKFRKGWEAAEFSYQPARWKKSYRFSVIRRPIPEEPEAQLTFFTLKKHAYQVIINNLPLSPEGAYRFYLGRCSQEGYIKELKLSFYIIKITTKKFLANEIYFHLHLFAYNIVNWFKILCLPKQLQKWTLQTIRTELLVLPARLLTSKKKHLLKLPTGHIYNWVFQYAIHKI